MSRMFGIRIKLVVDQCYSIVYRIAYRFIKDWIIVVYIENDYFKSTHIGQRWSAVINGLHRNILLFGSRGIIPLKRSCCGNHTRSVVNVKCSMARISLYNAICDGASPVFGIIIYCGNSRNILSFRLVFLNFRM